MVERVTSIDMTRFLVRFQVRAMSIVNFHFCVFVSHFHRRTLMDVHISLILSTSCNDVYAFIVKNTVLRALHQDILLCLSKASQEHFSSNLNNFDTILCTSTAINQILFAKIK